MKQYDLRRYSLKQFLELFLNALYPRRCPVCDGIVMPKGHFVCQECHKKLSYVRQPICKKCGKELISDRMEYCPDCLRHQRSFDYGLALLNYNEAARHSMAKIKYNNKRQYLEFYGAAISRRFEKQILRMRADALIPVPVHPSRRRKRGFNQAELLAREIGRRLDIPVCRDLLVRTRKTLPQKELNPAERLKNLEQAFQVRKAAGNIRSVILVDDIYTTGSTAEACTRALRQAGVEHVYVLSICIGKR